MSVVTTVVVSVGGVMTTESFTLDLSVFLSDCPQEKEISAMPVAKKKRRMVVGFAGKIRINFPGAIKSAVESGDFGKGMRLFQKSI